MKAPDRDSLEPGQKLPRQRVNFSRFSRFTSSLGFVHLGEETATGKRTGGSELQRKVNSHIRPRTFVYMVI